MKAEEAAESSGSRALENSEKDNQCGKSCK